MIENSLEQNKKVLTVEVLCLKFNTRFIVSTTLDAMSDLLCAVSALFSHLWFLIVKTKSELSV